MPSTNPRQHGQRDRTGPGAVIDEPRLAARAEAGDVPTEGADKVEGGTLANTWRVVKAGSRGLPHPLTPPLNYAYSISATNALIAGCCFSS